MAKSDVGRRIVRERARVMMKGKKSGQSPKKGEPASSTTDFQLAKKYPGPYRAMKCPCQQAGCHSWMVEPVAAIQGVNFTEEQARLVADTLNEEQHRKKGLW